MRRLVAATAVFVIVFAACGDDDEVVDEPTVSADVGTPTGNQSATAAPTATPIATTAAPAKTPSAADDERLQAILAEPGLPEFLTALAEAVDANAADWLLEHMHFRDYECTFTSGLPAEPQECHGSPGKIVQVISLGAWQSDGGFITSADMRDVLEQQLLDHTADDARLATIGQMTLGDDQEPDAADVLITGTTDSGQASVEHALSFAIARIDGSWAITEVDRALVEFLPDFYEWWVPWEEIDLPTG